MSLHQIAYLSSSRPQMPRRELMQLLASARAGNAQRGITGALLHAEGAFLQILEGEKAELAALYERLRVDPRHDGLVLLGFWPIALRGFEEPLEFVDARPADLRGMPGVRAYACDGVFPLGESIDAELERVRTELPALLPRRQATRAA